MALLVLNAVAAAAAGIVLVISPAAIPAIAGVHIDKSQYLVCYLLAGSEVATAWLCWFALRNGHAAALQTACATLIVLHLTTAGFAMLAYAANTPVVWLNIVFRLVISALLWLSMGASDSEQVDDHGRGSRSAPSGGSRR